MKSYSASALKTFTTCQTKYFHRYIWNTPKNKDYVTPEAFTFGSAFHWLLEKCKHKKKHFTNELLEEACNQYKLTMNEEGAKLYSMLQVYFTKFEKDFVLHCETNISPSENRKAIIDLAIIREGLWYIVDIKTTSEFCPYLPLRLSSDLQMQQYYFFVENIGLDMQNFGGVIYREVKKPLQRYKENETFESFSARCISEIRETFVKIDDTSDIEHVCNVVDELQNPIKNSSECIKFKNKCEYFDACHQPVKSPKEEPDPFAF